SVRKNFRLVFRKSCSRGRNAQWKKDCRRGAAKNAARSVATRQHPTCRSCAGFREKFRARTFRERNRTQDRQSHFGACAGNRGGEIRNRGVAAATLTFDNPRGVQLFCLGGNIRSDREDERSSFRSSGASRAKRAAASRRSR